MAVRSRALVEAAPVSAAQPLEYDVPIGRTALVKTTMLDNPSSTERSFILLRGTAVVFRTKVPPASTSIVVALLVLTPGDTYTWTINTGANSTVSMYGSLLDGEPT